MKIKKEAIAGTLESSDVMIKIIPTDDINDKKIYIHSSVSKQFDDYIFKTVKEILSKLQIENANIIIEDRGALECVLKARLKTALLRATDETINWGEIL